MLHASKLATLCGTWVSPLTAAAVTESTIGFSDVSADGATLYWLESRPTEQGRTALVRRRADGVVEDMTPPPINVASRVHEYGGGAYAVRDGHIVFSEKADGSVWLIEGDAQPRQITGVRNCRYADFRFVPGTDRVVCVREDHRGGPPGEPEAAIVVLDITQDVDAAANEGVVLIQGHDFLSSPRPSPDGQHIAWLSWDHPDMPWDATRLHLARLLPSGVQDAVVVVGADRREAVVQPEWSPDGVLHCCTDRTGWWNIYRLAMSADRMVPAVEAVTSILDGEIGGPPWTFGQRHFAFLPDGRIVAALIQDGRMRAVAVEGGTIADLGLPPVQHCPVALAGPGGMPELAYVRSAPETMQAVGVSRVGPDACVSRVIRSGGPDLLVPEDVSVAVPIAFPTPDGTIAHAFHYQPVNRAFAPLDGETPPLVVMIHGGPTSRAGDSFSTRIQWWTTRGFAVVDVNYRGSTGYGRDYREKLAGNWGVVDVEDCIAAVRHLVRDGRADPERIAIRGGSAGGFTALAALTSSDVFKAGASLYGIGDLMLLARETHKFEARYMDRLVGPLPEAAAVYAERSPINHLDRMTAGVIFFQGLDDKVVPPTQAATMVAAMRARGLPVAHYEFAGEGHGFRRAENQRRVLELELGFYGRMFGFVPPGLSEAVTLL
jgi:dipeptidyl aminopeptidase/acylaminoacyl peptidase